ncbi:MAG: cation:proton antiporter [Candidatus Omnitrophota bacterium]
MNILLMIGIIILVGVIAGKVFNKLNLPQVTGYIIIGLLLGESFHGLLSGPVMASFWPIINLALGIIGFMIGSEINFNRFKRYSRSIYTILLVETFLTFILVAASVIAFTHKIYMGLILGSLASATAPAATYSVLEEYKARGPLTTTAFSIVALDDALALIIYGFASVFARSLIVHESASFFYGILVPLSHIAASVLIGLTAGFVLYKISIKTRDKDKILSFTIGTIIFVVGLSIYFKLEPIFAAMVLGAVATNLQPPGKEETLNLIKKVSGPIFILFFVLVGAQLDARILTKEGVAFLAVIYIVSRSVGKLAGAYIGGRLSKAKNTVTKYLGFCLFDQAGVAVGLAIAVFHSFSSLGPETRAVGLMIMSIITATTFLLQLIAPPMIRYSVKKADEVNRNITAEDIIGSHKVKDVMEEDFFVLKENNNLGQIINVMKKSDAYNFPVVDISGDFVGIISLGDVRDAFNEEQMDLLVLAGDMLRDVSVTAYGEQDLKTVMDIFKTKHVDYIPVLAGKTSRKFIGQLNYAKVVDIVNREVLLRQSELEG